VGRHLGSFMINRKLITKKTKPDPIINKQLKILISIIIINILIFIIKFFTHDELLRTVLNIVALPGEAVSAFLATKYLIDRRII